MTARGTANQLKLVYCASKLDFIVMRWRRCSREGTLPNDKGRPPGLARIPNVMDREGMGVNGLKHVG